MVQGVIVPLALLATTAWLLPWVLGKVMPKSLWSLILNGLICAAVLTVAGMVLFAWLYGPTADIVWQAAPGHFLILSARAALLWGPILVLSLANLPRRWPPEDWALPGADEDR
ncbi:MAG: hypothetical protein AAGF30_16595 [Pseudomonadota bacterium]